MDMTYALWREEGQSFRVGAVEITVERIADGEVLLRFTTNDLNIEVVPLDEIDESFIERNILEKP